MGVFNLEPFIPRFSNLLLVFEGDVGLLIVDAVPDVNLVLEDALHMANRPVIRLVLRLTSVDVGEGAM